MSLLYELFGKKASERLCKAMIVWFIVGVINLVVIAYSESFAFVSLSFVPTLVWVIWYLSKEEVKRND